MELHLKFVKERETRFTVVYSEVGTEYMRQLRLYKDIFNGGPIAPVIFIRITDEGVPVSPGL